MTLTYFSKTSPAGTVVSGGPNQLAIVCTIAPDVGQYWLPTSIHVSTQTGVVCKADLYAGSTNDLNVPLPNFLWDTTFRGSNDTSTILSGLVIYYGQCVKVVFSGAFNTDNPSFTVSGISSDQPPPMGILPDIPGARFTFTEPGNQGSLVNQVGSNALQFTSTFGTFFFPTSFSSMFVGNMQNIYLYANITGAGGPGSGARIRVRWFTAVINGPGNSNMITQDVIDVRGNGTILSQTIAVKAPYVQFELENGNGQSNVTLEFLASDGGPMPSYSDFKDPGTFTTGAWTSQLLTLNPNQNIAAGGTFTTSGVGPAPGPAVFWCGTVDAGVTWTADIVSTTFDGNTTTIYHMDQTCTPWQAQRIILPSAPITLAVHNTSAGAHNFMWALTREPFYQFAS